MPIGKDHIWETCSNSTQVIQCYLLDTPTSFAHSRHCCFFCWLLAVFCLLRDYTEIKQLQLFNFLQLKFLRTMWTFFYVVVAKIIHKFDFLKCHNSFSFMLHNIGFPFSCLPVNLYNRVCNYLHWVALYFGKHLVLCGGNFKKCLLCGVFIYVYPSY